MSDPKFSRVWAMAFSWGHPAVPGSNVQVIATFNMDGTIWCDWEKMRELSELPLMPENAALTAHIMLAKTVMASRGLFVEVSEQRADEIAIAYGARGVP
jgi:hypothetical protein